MMLTVAALFWSLVHSIWQGLAVHAGVWLVTRRSRSAPHRYLLLCAAQLGLMVAFVSTLWHELHAASAVPAVAAPTAQDAQAWLPRLMLGSVVAWVAGISLMTARLLRALRDLGGLRQRAAPLLAWQPAVERAAARLGLRRAVAIVEAAVDSPLTLGWLRPLLLLPLGWAAQLPPQVVEAAILHELVHVRRHDYLINVAQHVVEALFFFHPSVHWLSRHVRAERELCCDQTVVDLHMDPLDYATALVALEQQRGFARLGLETPLGLAVARGELSARVEHVLSRRGLPHMPPQRGLGAAILALALIAAATSGACLGGTEPGNQSSLATTPDVTAPSIGPRWIPNSVSRYGQAIEAAGVAHGVDPTLVSLVVLVESRGNPDVQSPQGAVGLMQILPVTAAHIAAERGLPSPTLAQLRDPALNLDFGAYFLAQLLPPNDGPPSVEQVRLAAIGYNGGRELLRKYLEGHGVLWPETEHYARLLSQLWSERDADSSATYQSLGAQ